MNIDLIYKWQELIGAFLGTFIPICFWFFVRWIEKREQKNEEVSDDSSILEKQVSKLELQEKRYMQAYGSGIFTLEQLKDQLNPIREKIRSIKDTLNSINKKQEDISIVQPSKIDIETFTEEVKKQLPNLNFEAKRGIILRTVEKIIANRQELQVYGYIPVTTNVNVFTINRRCRPSKCR